MILAFDTATDQLTVALGTVGKITARFHEPAARAHLGRLLPTVDSLLASANLTVKDLNCLAVGIGPGSFTGLRIGVATAQGLAHALKKPLIGISTLDILAGGVALADRAIDPVEPNALIHPVIDAKRREIYTASYDATGRRLSEYQVLYPEDLAQNLEGSPRPVWMTGDGLGRYADTFSAVSNPPIKFAPEPLWLPDALVLIKLAEERIKVTESIPYWRVLPIYIRLSEAEEKLKREK